MSCARWLRPRTKLIIVNSPNNPCGSVIPEENLRRIAEIACEADAVVLSDEIYKDFYFEGSHASITRFPGMRERTVILDGLSKSYAMTGWRIGYGVMPEPLVEPVSRLMTNSVSCTAAFVQQAAVTALHSSQAPTEAMVAEFRERRSVIVDGLRALPGIRVREPKGAFYVFPNIEGTELSSREFEHKMLYEAGVSLLSGTAFGHLGDGYIRISFANSQANLSEALRRMEQALKV